MSSGGVSVDAPARVVIVDDDVLLREGLASLIGQHGFRVVAQSGDARGLGELVRSLSPDLVIIDIRMPPSHTVEGLTAAIELRAGHPGLGLLVLSSYVEVEHAIELLSSGSGTGYLLKQRITVLDDFLSSLRRLLAGESVIDPVLVQELLVARRVQTPLDTLTSREREVLKLMAEGLSNLGIGQALHLSEGTVEKHVHHILDKLQLGEEGHGSHRRVLAVIRYLDMA